MVDEAGEQSDYERLSEELRKSAGPLEFLVSAVQDGIELEDLAASRAGKVIIERAAHRLRSALEVILRASESPCSEAVQRAIFELRVQHRALAHFADVIHEGRVAARRIEDGEIDHVTTEEEDTEL